MVKCAIEIIIETDEVTAFTYIEEKERNYS